MDLSYLYDLPPEESLRRLRELREQNKRKLRDSESDFRNPRKAKKRSYEHGPSEFYQNEPEPRRSIPPSPASLYEIEDPNSPSSKPRKNPYERVSSLSSLRLSNISIIERENEINDRLTSLLAQRKKEKRYRPSYLNRSKKKNFSSKLKNDKEIDQDIQTMYSRVLRTLDKNGNPDGIKLNQKKKHKPTKKKKRRTWKDIVEISNRASKESAISEILREATKEGKEKIERDRKKLKTTTKTVPFSLSFSKPQKKEKADLTLSLRQSLSPRSFNMHQKRLDSLPIHQRNVESYILEKRMERDNWFKGIKAKPIPVDILKPKMKKKEKKKTTKKGKPVNKTVGSTSTTSNEKKKELKNTSKKPKTQKKDDYDDFEEDEIEFDMDFEVETNDDEEGELGKSSKFQFKSKTTKPQPRQKKKKLKITKKVTTKPVSKTSKNSNFTTSKNEIPFSKTKTTRKADYEQLLTFHPSIKTKVPDFKKLQTSFQKKLKIKKKSFSKTVVKPFSFEKRETLKTSGIVTADDFKVIPERGVTKRRKKSKSIVVKKLHTFKETTASKLRKQRISKRMEKRQKEKEEREKELARIKEKQKEINKKYAPYINAGNVYEKTQKKREKEKKKVRVIKEKKLVKENKTKKEELDTKLGKKRQFFFENEVCDKIRKSIDSEVMNLLRSSMLDDSTIDNIFDEAKEIEKKQKKVKLNNWCY